MRAVRLVLVLLSLFALVPVGIHFWLFPAETTSDRERILREIAIPSDFSLLSRVSDGSRARLANRPPFSTAVYSAPWEEGVLCDRVERIASELAGSKPTSSSRYPASACAYLVHVASGWRARLVNERFYDATLRAYRPGEIPPPLSAYDDRLGASTTLVVITIGGKVGF